MQFHQSFNWNEQLHQVASRQAALTQLMINRKLIRMHFTANVGVLKAALIHRRSATYANEFLFSARMESNPIDDLHIN